MLSNFLYDYFGLYVVCFALPGCYHISFLVCNFCPCCFRLFMVRLAFNFVFTLVTICQDGTVVTIVGVEMWDKSGRAGKVVLLYRKCCHLSAVVPIGRRSLTDGSRR